MKIFLTSLFFSLSCLPVSAQQDRFIYLQTENKQPFFVKINNKVLNSYPLGYLIIPKLDDGLYSLVLGFPETTVEQEFNCSINKKDVGFIIKNAGDKQWQLLNVQTNNVIVPGDVITKPVIIYEKETDPFSTMLASAVHDSTILRKDVAREILVEKPMEQIPKDTANTLTLNKDVAISKPDNILQLDTTHKDIAKEVISEKPNVEKQKDTTQIISNNNVAVLKTDSIKTDVAKEMISKKADDIIQKDTAQTTISGSEVAVTKTKKKRSKKNDNALKDSTITQKDIAKKTISEKTNVIIPKDTTQTIVSKSDVAVIKVKKKRKKNDTGLEDSANVQKDVAKGVPEKINVSKDNIQTTNSNNDVASLRSVIKRKSRKNSKEGIFMLYVDDNGETKDTIRLLIPYDKKTKAEVKITEPFVSVPTEDAKIDKSDYKITKEEKNIIKEANKEAVPKSTMINSDCKSFATEDDFLKIRKKMVAENSDEDMIKAARKIFKTKCFTTEQIKNLSVLFLKDESKYMFFDIAYPFVSDSDVYSTLEKQLSDAYYITRFRAMIHK